MKDTVAKESYVERWEREQKEKMGIPSHAEKGIPVNSQEGIPSESEKGIPAGAEKEVKKDGKDTRGKGQAAPTESGNGK